MIYSLHHFTQRIKNNQPLDPSSPWSLLSWSSGSVWAPARRTHVQNKKNKKTPIQVRISHVIFDAGDGFHSASPLRHSLLGRPPGGNGTWPPWWRWTSRPSPGKNSQDAASVPLMSDWNARCHTPSIYSVLLVSGREPSGFFLTLSAPAHSDVQSRCCSVVDISEWQRCWTNPMNPLWQ